MGPRRRTRPLCTSPSPNGVWRVFPAVARSGLGFAPDFQNAASGFSRPLALLYPGSRVYRECVVSMGGEVTDKVAEVEGQFVMTKEGERVTSKG